MLLTIIVLKSCASGIDSPKFKIKVNQKIFIVGDTLKLSVKNNKNRPLDSIHYFLKNKKIESSYVFSQIDLLGDSSVEIFVFVNGKDHSDTLSFNHIYMAELNKNALFSLYGYWGESKKQQNSEGSGVDYITQKISFNPYHKTVIWGITLDNRLAVIKPNKMSLLKKGGNIDVEMFVSSNEINDLDKLRKLLGFA